MTLGGSLGAARRGSLRDVRLSHVITALEELYPPAWAESWDAVGLVCGDPDQDVDRVLFAVDPVAAVIDEALEWGAGLVVTHHPLLLRGVHSVAATTPKGRLVHRMIRNGIALHTAHTNADRADPGVSDALARAVGLTGGLRPMVPADDDPRRGLGRIGELDEPVTLREFTRRVAAGLPPTAWGVRAAGDPDRPVRTVAVCGGAGDSCSAPRGRRCRRLPHRRPAAPSRVGVRRGRRAGAGGRRALGDRVAVARRRRTAPGRVLPEAGKLETRVSTLVTDAWRLHEEGAQ